MTDKTIEQAREEIDQARKRGKQLKEQLSKKQKELRRWNKIGLILLLIAFIVVIMIPILYAVRDEIPSKITQLELDIRMIVPQTDDLPKKDDHGKPIHIYEDDKILIHSSSNNQRYVYVPHPNIKYYNLPRDINDRQAKFLDQKVTTNVWIKDKEKLILVYHSYVDMRNQWRSPRSQDDFRSNLTYHKGKWVEYIQNLAKSKRKELDDIAKPYRQKSEQRHKKEREKLEKEQKQKKMEEEKTYGEYKDKVKQRERIEKERYERETTPINDSHIFK